MNHAWLSLALAISLGFLVSPAHADIWDFVWSSEGDYLVVVTVPGGGNFVRITTTASDRTTATITPRSDTRLLVQFATDAGTARVNVNADDPGGLFTDTLLPFNVPLDCCPPEDNIPITLQLGGFPGGGPTEWLGRYSWTGNFRNPDTFAITARAPGSGPSPNLFFQGTGTRSSKPPVVAPEPAVLLLTAAGFGMVVVLRRAGRL